VTSWLIDKSALVRLGASSEASVWADRVERGLVCVTSVTLLEVGYSARSGADLRRASARPPLASLLLAHLTPAMEDRAREVQLALADRGRHRAPSIPDLLVGAVAELSGLVVLHLDKDFEVISEFTRQPVERLAL
jgi:predicted nucleic acid-binding protein